MVSALLTKRLRTTDLALWQTCATKQSTWSGFATTTASLSSTHRRKVRGIRVVSIQSHRLGPSGELHNLRAGVFCFVSVQTDERDTGTGSHVMYSAISRDSALCAAR